MSKISFREILIMSCASMILFLFVLVGSGVVFSGYHLVDDHATVDIFNYLQSEKMGVAEFIKTLFIQAVTNLTPRFRPNYMPELYIGTALFGLDFNKWMFFSTFEGIVTFALLYVLARILDIGCYESFLFAGIVIFGPQITPWYRPPNQENAGLLFMAAEMVFIVLMIKESENDGGRGRYLLYKAASIIIAVLDAFQKESFLIILPSFLIFIAAYETVINKRTFRDIIKKYADMAVIYFAVFFLSIFIIIKYTGTNSIQYAGIDPEYTAVDYLIGMASILFHSPTLIMTLCGGVMLVISRYVIGKSNMIDDIKAYFWLFLFIAYSAFVEIVLHVKSRMYERYYLPYMVFVAFLDVIIISGFLRERKLIYRLYICIITLFLAGGVAKSYSMARSWSSWGEETAELLSYVSEELSRDETAEVFSGLAGEVNMSIDVWERLEHGSFVFSGSSDYSDALAEPGKYDIIILDKDALDKFDFSGYRIFTTESYMVASRI